MQNEAQFSMSSSGYSRQPQGLAKFLCIAVCALLLSGCHSGPPLEGKEKWCVGSSLKIFDEEMWSERVRLRSQDGSTSQGGGWRRESSARVVAKGDDWVVNETESRIYFREKLVASSVSFNAQQENSTSRMGFHKPNTIWVCLSRDFSNSEDAPYIF